MTWEIRKGQIAHSFSVQLDHAEALRKSRTLQVRSYKSRGSCMCMFAGEGVLEGYRYVRDKVSAQRLRRGR